MEKYFETGFTCNTTEIIGLLGETRFLQGKVFGKMASLEDSLQSEAVAESIVLEIAKSSEIDGEITNYELLKPEVQRLLFPKKKEKVSSPTRERTLVTLFFDAINFDVPLTTERLINWMSACEQREITKPAIYSFLNDYISWFNHFKNNDPLYVAAVSHLMMLKSELPFNSKGFLARQITNHLLAESEKSRNRFYCVSLQLRKERKAYFELSNAAFNNHERDITNWVKWFLTCLIQALKSTESIQSRTLFKSEFWKRYSKINLNERQTMMIDLLINEFSGKLTSTKWAEITGCSSDSALRDIQDLMEKNVLRKEYGGGRSTCYELKIWDLL